MTLAWLKNRCQGNPSRYISAAEDFTAATFQGKDSSHIKTFNSTEFSPGDI